MILTSVLQGGILSGPVNVDSDDEKVTTVISDDEEAEEEKEEEGDEGV